MIETDEEPENEYQNIREQIEAIEKELKDEEYCRRLGIYPFKPIIKPW